MIRSPGSTRIPHLWRADRGTVALSAAAGPDTLGANSGDLQTVRLVVSTNSLTPGGLSATGTAFADFANVTNVNVTTLPTTQFSSSDSGVATVSAAGVIEAVAPGTATIRVAYGGKEASASHGQHEHAPPPKLIHRYSFSDAAGSTTIKDSVGSANGTSKAPERLVAANWSSMARMGTLTFPIV
jgi:hypothetical protein